MGEVKLGVVGLGKMGILHYGNFNSMPEGNVVCAAESNKRVYDYTKKLLDVPIFNDYKDLLKKDIDSVVVCVPDEFHSDIGIYFAENGVNVFMEKPLADSMVNAQKMAEVSENNGIINQVGFFIRFSSTFKKGKEILEKNILGNIYHTRGYSYEGLVFKNQKGWRFSKEDHAIGGSLLDIGSHLIDIMLWYFGDIETVYGITKDAYSNTDFGSSILRFKNGLKALIDFSWSSYSHRQMHLEINIEGSNGFMKITNDYIKLFLKESIGDFKEGWSTIYKVELYEPSEFLLGVETAYYDEDLHFVNCCKKNKKTSVDWNSGLKNQSIIESILKSNKSNNVIEVRDLLER